MSLKLRSSNFVFVLDDRSADAFTPRRGFACGSIIITSAIPARVGSGVYWIDCKIASCYVIARGQPCTDMMREGRLIPAGGGARLMIHRYVLSVQRDDIVYTAVMQGGMYPEKIWPESLCSWWRPRCSLVPCRSFYYIRILSILQRTAVSLKGQLAALMTQFPRSSLSSSTRLLVNTPE